MLAQKSLAFNLRNTNFCELFPDIVSEIKQRLQGTKAESASTSKSSSGSAKSANGQTNGSVIANDSLNKNASSANEQPAMPTDACATDGVVVGAAAAAVDLGSGGPAALKNCARNSYLNWQSIYSNLVIVICFAIFALIVNYVIKNLNQE